VRIHGIRAAEKGVNCTRDIRATIHGAPAGCMRFAGVVVSFLLAGVLGAQVSRTPPKPKPFTEGPPVGQPIPYSHKTHVAFGLKCIECHEARPPGDYAGFPAESMCMACHVAIKKDSPHIKRLAEAAAAKTRIRWNRVYVMKEFVYFSHDRHFRKGGVDCIECHGAVASRDVLFQEKPTDMYSCMKCHEQRKAPNQCDVCHDTH
jgi:hypothetical protein